MHRPYTGGCDAWFRDHEAHRVRSLFCHMLRPPLTNLRFIGYNGLLLGLNNELNPTRYTVLDALLDEIDSTRAHAVAAASQVSNAYIIVPYLYLIQDSLI